MEQADRTRVDVPSPSEIYEQGFHWSRANAWSHAMSCFYRSGMTLNSMGILLESRRHLLLAYTMLNKLKMKAGIQVGDTLFPAKFQNHFDDILFSGSGGNNQDSHHVISSVMDSGMRKLQKVDVYHIFDGDSELLEVGLNVLLRLAQSCQALDSDPAITSKLFEDALEIMALVRAYDLSGNVIKSPRRSPRPTDSECQEPPLSARRHKAIIANAVARFSLTCWSIRDIQSSNWASQVLPSTGNVSV